MTARSTPYSSHRRSRLRSHSISPRRACRMAYLRRCHAVRIRSDKIASSGQTASYAAFFNSSSSANSPRMRSRLFSYSASSVGVCSARVPFLKNSVCWLKSRPSSLLIWETLSLPLGISLSSDTMNTLMALPSDHNQGKYLFPTPRG